MLADKQHNEHQNRDNGGQNFKEGFHGVVVLHKYKI
ncbi:hypothetical protein FIC_00710 [Flavobacteriaceae bacterium 3519-10]|nr:hypothetical protein FIC_00710 [Flavobacteriaceae bacterium 3519-10]